MEQTKHDVIIVGASIAGSAAAIFYAKEGYSVLLLEKARDSTHYKKICTHFIQPSAVPVIRRLGIEDKLLKAGALKNSIDVWSPHGWIRPTIINRDDSHYCNYGYNVTREVFDPIIHNTVNEYKSVEVKYSNTVKGLVFDGDQVIGVEGLDADKKAFKYYSDLVVAADGRNSRLPKLAALEEKKYANDRFTYYAYFTGVTLQSGDRSQFWFFGEKSLFAYPLADGVTLLCVFEDKKKHDQWKGNIEEKFLESFKEIPSGPNMERHVRISEYRGMFDLTNELRRAGGHGIAAVGDAALAADPMSGVGCGWALQSAEWLVEETKIGLRSRPMLNVSLKRYAARHYKQLSPHAKFIFSASLSRPHNFIENLIFKAAAKDEKVANSLNDFIARNISVSSFLSVPNVTRVLYAAAFK